MGRHLTSTIFFSLAEILGKFASSIGFSKKKNSNGKGVLHTALTFRPFKGMVPTCVGRLSSKL